jgi:hypothetical protein
MESQRTYPSGTVLLMVSTKRGLFLVSSRDRRNWEVEATALGGRTFNAALDQRTGKRLFAAENGDFFGSFLRYSDDFGATWHEPERGIEFSEASGRKLTNLWVIEPGRASEPDTIYLGVDPASLWISRDGGVTWDINAGLEAHPTRAEWNPGNGGLCLHSIVLDYANPQRMWVGISAVGCMRTEDGGQTWVHANTGTRADFNPEPYPEYGQCIHRVLQHPTEPDKLYQQNHCGVYKTANAGTEWIDIQRDLPRDQTSVFGFPIALDVHHPETVYVIAEGGERHNFGQQFTVYRTRDAGDSWEPLHEGLPAGEGVRLGVLRHGMSADTLDPCGVYVGTNTGQLFASDNRGDAWKLIADYLPPIYSVNAAVIV